MQTMLIIWLQLILIGWIQGVAAFPSGAPADACDTLTPRHPGRLDKLPDSFDD